MFHFTSFERFSSERHRFFVPAVLLISTLAVPPAAAFEIDGFEDFEEDLSLTGLSLEELMSIRVTSVAGVEMDWFTTPSAMYVLTADEIRRAGHQSLPEALRMVPGVNVGKTSSSTWAISTRGFQHRYANMQQVLIDGRSIYDPFFSGVQWHKQHVLLEDLDRIEVIRGPGATLWGANAVNGVINVTTRPASETQGLYLSGVTGSYYNALASARYGDRIDDNTHYRVWTSYRNFDHFRDAEGGNFPDAWDITHGGFRLDHEAEHDIRLTFQSDVYGSNRINYHVLEPNPDVPFTFNEVKGRNRSAGGYVFGRITQEFGDEDQYWSLQAYYDYSDDADNRDNEFQQHTADLDFRQHFHPLDRHDLVWGLGYRFNTDRIRENEFLSLDSDHRDRHTFSAFAQDTITLAPDLLTVMVGSKFEHNSFTRLEYQPSIRVALTPTERQTIWASVARAVHTPYRSNTDTTSLVSYLPFPPPFDRWELQGNPDLRSTTLLAYEAGYRIKFTDTLGLDTAVFLNRYRHLITWNDTFTQWINRGSATTYGVETAAT